MPPIDDIPPIEIPSGEAPQVNHPLEEEMPVAANDEALVIRLEMLQEEHSDLGLAIDALGEMPSRDSLALARLKKRKLRLKDEIERLRDQITPDIIA